ncbi:hypothetical protein [Halopelagius longus]|uniref:Profilin fold domain-containing protein n=1 Tax=Halopelagius longus TaxID=1236180 RepID=A0A1H0Y114_9EURY|nr:hypothetical protein [Halopelagius longus]RDI72216.1 hypothetical protein DWB78_11120 [Halopelagius longus]SDQ08838.1 hypothetical protein SAMN05216278_0332 [Halopelagius longus]
MNEGPEFDVTDAHEVVSHRDEVVSWVTDHAGQIARQLALLQGGDYGQSTFKTDKGKWTVKYEGGDLQYLRYEGRSGGETYVVSTKHPPDPEELAQAMTDYDAFVAAYNDHVESLDGVLDGVPEEFPEAVSTESIVAERDRIVGRIRDVSDAIASELYRYEGSNYGSFSTTVSGTRWELKWEDGRASYLRVGGEGGIYLLSQYEPPSAPDVRRLAEEFAGFVEAYNDHVEELESDLATVSLGEETAAD